MSAMEKYAEARARVIRLIKEVGDVAQMLISVGTALRTEPLRFIFSNTSPGLPAEASMGRAASSNANDWMTPAEIQQLLLDLHTAKDDMMSAWSSLSPDQQASMAKPANVGSTIGYRH